MLADEQRILPLECGFNFRDFGGYATGTGGRVKTGMLYRAGLMSFVEELGRDRLTSLGIVAICDLRSSNERGRRPTRWHEGLPIDLWARDYAHTSADLFTSMRESRIEAAEARDWMLQLYRDIAFEHAESFRALFEMLLNGKAPLVVNCSAGKDRTGTAVALVLSALEVPRETILADYMLTGRADFSYLMSRMRGDLSLSPEAMAPILAVDPDYLTTLFSSIEERSGSLRHYLDRELGIGEAEMQRLRTLLVDG